MRAALTRHAHADSLNVKSGMPATTFEPGRDWGMCGYQPVRNSKERARASVDPRGHREVRSNGKNGDSHDMAAPRVEDVNATIMGSTVSI